MRLKHLWFALGLAACGGAPPTDPGDEVAGKSDVVTDKNRWLFQGRSYQLGEGVQNAWLQNHVKHVLLLDCDAASSCTLTFESPSPSGGDVSKVTGRLSQIIFDDGNYTCGDGASVVTSGVKTLVGRAIFTYPPPDGPTGTVEFTYRCGTETMVLKDANEILCRADDGKKVLYGTDCAIPKSCNGPSDCAKGQGCTLDNICVQSTL
jgi:hypothetical protein